ncbi:MFS transporter [Salinicoccus hispanicus]|uniref:MFS transporter n=1 Tax=Salinicoccus hispanicus TaxID=157225 RepID=A0A6N8U359_9STAP|nr:MFS transporter [Salinicoccus hispanicus]MXQ50109.1 MFS transporter [Salinicoccus hispanicus]
MLVSNKWKYPLLLLFGIGVSNLGAWIYLIALNLIVLDMTGSVFAVSFLYIMMPIATVITNFWAGSFIDRLNKRNLMIYIDLLRASLVCMLPFMDSIIFIYILVFIINIGSSIFEPTAMVYMTELIPKKDRQRFNALRNFINSSGFILGPSIAGVLLFIGSPEMAILANGLALLISAFVIRLLPSIKLQDEAVFAEKVNLKVVIKDWKTVLSFSKMNMNIALIYCFFSGITVFMTALDSLEAAFATQVLLLSESDYGFLVSIAGLGIIVGSLINTLFADRLKINLMIGLGAIFTPAGYLIFGYSENFIWASIGFFTLTFALSFANTGFYTFYQNSVPTNIMGRFSSVFGILEAFLIIIFTLTIGVLAEQFGIRIIYILGSFLFLLLGLVVNLFAMKRSIRDKYQQEVS